MLLADPGEFLPEDEIDEKLRRRLNSLHLRRRLGIERDHEKMMFGRGAVSSYEQDFPLSQSFITTVLKLTGLYWMGQRNAARVQVRTNHIVSSRVPPGFHNFTILHLSDLHVDMSKLAMQSLVDLVKDLTFNICVLTGDYRARTFGSVRPCLVEMANVINGLNKAFPEAIYAVLGNHDSIRMVPDLEHMGVKVLLNEFVVLEREGDLIHLSGVDDAHFYRADNIDKATSTIPHEDFSILLSHTPEIYRQAANSGFDMMLSGHTHGGQICLPSGRPIALQSKLPRPFGAGAWKYKSMAGYTSVGAGSCLVPVRFFCPPEITLHRLCSFEQTS